MLNREDFENLMYFIGPRIDEVIKGTMVLSFLAVLQTIFLGFIAWKLWYP